MMSTKSPLRENIRALCLDWDLVITNWDETLSKKRADEIAARLLKLKSMGFKIYVVSLANQAHIKKMTIESKSEAFQEIFLAEDVIKLSIDDRRHLVQMNHKRGESLPAMRKMIASVMGATSLETSLLPDWIYGYKKSHALEDVRNRMKIPPSDIVFLDDNIYNVLFARHMGFRGYLINNHPDISYLNLLSLLDWLIMIHSKQQGKRRSILPPIEDTRIKKGTHSRK